MGWYKTGTIAISGATVTGTGTNWTDNKQGIGPGQALLIPAAGTVKMYEILRVDSATTLTLTSDAGTVSAGQAYAIMSFYSDSVPDFARRLAAQLSYYQTQMDGWQQIMTGTGSINITAPDGTSVTISSFKKLTDDMNNKADLDGGAVAIVQGGTGATTKEVARTNLGLGSSAVKDTGTAQGNVMVVGTDMGTPVGEKYKFFQIGSEIEVSTTSMDTINGAGLYNKLIPSSSANNSPIVSTNYWYVLNVGRSNMGAFTQFALPYATQTHPGRMFFRGFNTNAFSPWAEFYTTMNTTKASDGTLKAASPVARIVTSQEVCQRADIAEDGFVWCGSGTANAEAEGINISRLDVGVYVLTGSAGLASEGWQLLPPMDPGGMGELGVVEAEQTESGGLTIRLFKRKYMLSDDGEIVKTKGEPIDVPENSWIDVRLDMPEDSIWNRKQREATEGVDLLEGSGS
ncbi:pyocin knob domain-containing protein [Scandinavium sp.]|uniref:pyocin knob domain-containing protein n=1 Tax=Scandinavium sp. TaxID=2830653 RepID=UPI00289CC9D1|nr:pyocin knob domain-containing protein [Scandinavium sp.]